MNIDKNKIDEATELIKLAINDYDSFLKKIDSFDPENNQLFTIYPNPSNSIIIIKAVKNNLTSIKIYDISGKKIRTITAESLIETIDISNLKIGVYILKINNTKSIRFLKK